MQSGPQLNKKECVLEFVDHGLLRKNEVEDAMSYLKFENLEQIKFDFFSIDLSKKSIKFLWESTIVAPKVKANLRNIKNGSSLKNTTLWSFSVFSKCLCSNIAKLLWP